MSSSECECLDQDSEAFEHNPYELGCSKAVGWWLHVPSKAFEPDKHACSAMNECLADALYAEHILAVLGTNVDILRYLLHQLCINAHSSKMPD